MTPYFTNFSLSGLFLRAGRGPSVATLWRQGWGWMLGRGATTWWEVFDDRWSHCHYWSGAPTWQMSRYGLGLHSALSDEGRPITSIMVNDLGLDNAHGRVHVPGAGWTEVSWTRVDDDLEYILECPEAISLARNGTVERLGPGRHRGLLGRDRAGMYS